MKISAERSLLVDALKTVSRSVTLRSSVGQLAGLVCLTARESSLNFLTTDLDTATSCSIPVSVHIEGKCVVASRLLADITASLPDGSISLSVEDGMLIVSNSESKFRLRFVDSDEFPPISFPTGDTMHVNRLELNKCLKQVLKAASKDDTRPILTSVSISKIDGGVQFISTDSYRLAFTRAACDNVELLEGKEILVPARVLADVVRYISQPPGVSATDDMVSIYVSDNDAVISFNNVKMFTRLIDGKFPSFDSVTKQEYNNILTVDRTHFGESVKRVALLARDNASKVNIECMDDHVVLSVHSPQVGDAEEILPAKFVGDQYIPIAFNPAFLLDGIDVLSGANIEIKFHDDKVAALISSDDDSEFQYYLMPIRIKS